MNQPQWIRIELDKIENPPLYLEAGDWCCFLREYTSGGGYSASTGNNDISNFKKKPDKKGTPQWTWKEHAARKFATELAALFKDRALCICVMPSSKVNGDPEHDPRFDMVLAHLRQLCPNLTVVAPIRKRTSTQPLHEGGQRQIASVYQSLEWVGFPGPAPEALVVIDDMVTCGTTFKACKQLLVEHCPRMQVLGVFWTRCIWKPGFPPESDPD